MTRAVVKIAPGGLEAVLKSGEVADMVRSKADAVAAAANGELGSIGHPEMTAVVETYVTDRAAAQVVILHAGAMAVQAKYGVLTRAASSAGLELRAYGG